MSDRHPRRARVFRSAHEHSGGFRGSRRPSSTGEAKAAYDSGRLLFDDGDSPGALAKFSHSYDVSHDARLLWNMAACEKELRHYARAATLIGRYLKEGGNRIAVEQWQSALDTQYPFGQPRQ